MSSREPRIIETKDKKGVRGLAGPTGGRTVRSGARDISLYQLYQESRLDAEWSGCRKQSVMECMVVHGMQVSGTVRTASAPFWVIVCVLASIHCDPSCAMERP